MEPKPFEWNSLKANVVFDEHLLQDIEQGVDFVMLTGEPGRAHEVFDILNARVDQKRLYPEIANRYRFALDKLRVAALSGLSEKDIQSSFTEHLVGMLIAQDDLELLEARLLLLFLRKADEMFGDQERKQILKYMGQNQEVLGKFIIEEGNRPARATLGNWLIDFNKFVASLGPQARYAATERAAYLTKSQNVRHLQPEEKKALLRFLELYTWLKTGLGAQMPEIIYNAGTDRLIPPPPVPRRAVPMTAPVAPVQRVTKELKNPPKPAVQVSATPSPNLSREGRGNERGQEREVRKSVIDEDVLRETLAELQKMRGETAKPATGAMRVTSPQPSPRQEREEVPYKPFSVNEAIVRGNLNLNEENGSGIAAGQEDIEEKLKKLEKKIGDKGNSR